MFTFCAGSVCKARRHCSAKKVRSFSFFSQKLYVLANKGEVLTASYTVAVLSTELKRRKKYHQQKLTHLYIIPAENDQQLPRVFTPRYYIVVHSGITHHLHHHFKMLVRSRRDGY